MFQNHQKPLLLLLSWQRDGRIYWPGWWISQLPRLFCKFFFFYTHCLFNATWISTELHHAFLCWVVLHPQMIEYLDEKLYASSKLNCPVKRITGLMNLHIFCTLQDSISCYEIVEWKRILSFFFFEGMDELFLSPPHVSEESFQFFLGYWVFVPWEFCSEVCSNIASHFCFPGSWNTLC